MPPAGPAGTAPVSRIGIWSKAVSVGQGQPAARKGYALELRFLVGDYVPAVRSRTCLCLHVCYTCCWPCFKGMHACENIFECWEEACRVSCSHRGNMHGRPWTLPHPGRPSARRPSHQDLGDASKSLLWAHAAKPLVGSGEGMEHSACRGNLTGTGNALNPWKSTDICKFRKSNVSQAPKAPRRQCSAYVGASSFACRRRRPGADGPAVPGSSRAASLKWTSPTGTAALSLPLLLRCGCTGLPLHAGVPGSAAVRLDSTSATSATRAGARRCWCEFEVGACTAGRPARALACIKCRNKQERQLAYAIVISTLAGAAH